MVTPLLGASVRVWMPQPPRAERDEEPGREHPAGESPPTVDQGRVGGEARHQVVERRPMMAVDCGEERASLAAEAPRRAEPDERSGECPLEREQRRSDEAHPG